MPMRQAILFDLDNTLFDRDLAFEKFVRANIELSEARWKSICQVDCHGHGNRIKVLQLLNGLGLSLENPVELSKSIALYAVMDPELVPMLEQLASQFELGIITNGSVTGQTRKWRELGLDRLIDRSRLWISNAMGISKPDSRIFLTAVRQLGMEAAHCLYIGDHLWTDVLAARRAGLVSSFAAEPLTAVRLKGVVAGWQKNE